MRLRHQLPSEIVQSFLNKVNSGEKNLKISKTSKQRSLTFNEYQPAGRRRGVPDSHIIGTGMLLGKLELKRLRRLYFKKKYDGVWLFYLDISLPTALREYTHLGLTDIFI